MMKAAGLTAVLFGLGAGAMSVLSGWLGGLSEAAALAMVGASLLGTSQVLAMGLHPERSRGTSPSL